MCCIASSRSLCFDTLKSVFGLMVRLFRRTIESRSAPPLTWSGMRGITTFSAAYPRSHEGHILVPRSKEAGRFHRCAPNHPQAGE